MTIMLNYRSLPAIPRWNSSSLRIIVITAFPISKAPFIAIPTRTSASSAFSSRHPRRTAGYSRGLRREEGSSL